MKNKINCFLKKRISI